MTKALKTSAEGRICKYPNCRQVLSIYNHQVHCRIHQQQMHSEEQFRTYKDFSK